MVTHRVLQAIEQRLVALLALLLVLIGTSGSALADREEPAEGASTEQGPPLPAALVDLRAGDEAFRRPNRELFAEALGALRSIELREEPDLLALLYRDQTSLYLNEGRETLSSAIVSFGALDCASASRKAKQAAAELAAADAFGAEARDELRQALLYRFLCADRHGHFYEAMEAANMLRALGGDERPKGISDATWRKYPQLDAASNQRSQEVTLVSNDVGASFWVDFVPVDELRDPSGTLLLSEGEHLLVAVSPRGANALYVQVADKSELRVDIVEKRPHWRGIELLVKELQDAKGLQREDAMRDLMSALELRVAYVMREPGKVSVWILPENSREVELVGAAPNAALATTLATERLSTLEKEGVNPGLLRERDIPPKKKKASKAWIYAMAVGAVLVTSAIVVGANPAEDRQRIEVTLP